MTSAKENRKQTRTSRKDLVDHVVRTTTDLLEEEGVQAVTIRAIAARSGVAPMSVYNHFGDKQGLLTAVAQEHFAALAHDLARITEADPHKRLREAGRVVHGLMTTHPRSYDLMWTTPPGDATQDAFTQLVHIVEYGQAAGAFISADPVDLASTIWAAIHGAISIEVRRARTGDEPVNRANKVDFPLMLDVILRGVSTS